MTTPAEDRPRLRPLAVGEILDVSIKIFVSHWRTLLTAALVVVVPVQIVITILTADYTVQSFDLTDTSQTPEQTLEEINEYLGGLVISAVLQMLAVVLASAACFRAIAQAYLGEEVQWRSSLAYALRRTPQLLLITLLYMLGCLVATLFFIAPGVWLYIAWAFAVPVLLVEGIGGRRSLGRSFGLVKGRWWRTFGVLVLGLVLALVVSTVIQGVFLVGMFAGSDNDLLVLFLSAIAGVAGLAITTPFQAALLAVVYFDLRVRKEGFDLQLLAERIGGTVPAGGGGLAPTGPAPGTVPPPVATPPPATQGATAQHWPSPQPPAPPPREPERAPPPRLWAPAPPPPGWPAPVPNGTGSREEPEEGGPPDDLPRQPGVPNE